MPTVVSDTAAAGPEEALRHFEANLTFETDCWDVNYAINNQLQDFVLVDVRSPDLFVIGHLPGAINIPHGKITEHCMAEFPGGTLFVVYCAGPHCNGADKAAIRLARLGRAVKVMIGGIKGWKDGGFNLAIKDTTNANAGS